MVLIIVVVGQETELESSRVTAPLETQLVSKLATISRDSLKTNEIRGMLTLVGEKNNVRMREKKDR